MAEIRKLSVEKTLNKLRSNDTKQSKEALSNAKNDAIDEDITRMRAQRLRLESHRAKHQERTEDRAAKPTSPPRYTFWIVGIALVLAFALISLWLMGT